MVPVNSIEGTGLRRAALIHEGGHIAEGGHGCVAVSLVPCEVARGGNASGWGVARRVCNEFEGLLCNIRFALLVA